MARRQATDCPAKSRANIRFRSSRTKFHKKPCLAIFGQVARWLDSGAVQSLQQLDLSSVIDRVARYAEHEAEPRRFG